jgi:hypothetical protein
MKNKVTFFQSSKEFIGGPLLHRSPHVWFTPKNLQTHTNLHIPVFPHKLSAAV